MTMTENEASQKWCPFARLSEMGGTMNRMGPAANVQCIGSACMAWQRHETAEFKATAEAEFRKSGRRLETTTGYCGLAARAHGGTP